MTAPGDANNVGSIVAYLVMRREDWERGVRQTEQDSARLGRLSPTIRIDDNAAAVIGRLELVHAAEHRVGQGASEAKPFVVNLWAALAAVAPAAVPIAGVLTGGLIGALPVLAAVALGVKGISTDLKTGALAGTKYGADLHALGVEGEKLQQIAAGGLLSGLDRGLDASHGLFGEVNRDVAVMSSQIGDIVAGGVPALLHILTALNPLFVTFGSELTKGADKLEHWSQSSDGVSRFVSYVQAELPEVEHIIGNVTTLVAHLLEGAAPAGAGLLHDLNLLTGAIDSIPVGVLQTAIPLVISLYAAIKTGQGVTAVVNGIGLAYAKLKAPLAASAATAEASSLATQAAAADEAASVAEAKAVEARATAVAAEQIAASVAGTSSVLAAGAGEAAIAAGEFAAAMEAEAAAAATAAAEISASAAAAGEAAETAGAGAAAGWSAMLGPAAAVAVGVGLLATIMAHGKSQTQDIAQATNSYADALIRSKGAIDDNVTSTIAKNLADKGAIDLAAKYGLTLSDLTKSVLGNADAQAKVNAATAPPEWFNAASKALARYNDLSSADKERIQGAIKLRRELGLEAEGLDKGAESADAQRQAVAAATAATAEQTAKLHTNATAYGTTVSAYEQAAEAARKNTQQTRQQTLAFQLENNAAGLLNQALETLAGQNLNVAQAQTAVASSTQSVIQSMTADAQKIGDAQARVHAAELQLNQVRSTGKASAAQLASAENTLRLAREALAKAESGHTSSIKGNSAAAIANQQAIQGQVEAARQLATAVAQQTHSNDKAVESYKHSKKALEDELRAHHELTPAVKRYIDRLYDVKGISDYLSKHPTKADLQDEASKKIKTIEDRIGHLRHGLKVGDLKINTSEAEARLKRLQAQLATLLSLNNNVGQAVHDAVNNLGPAPQHHAAGGQVRGMVYGSGTRGADSVLAELAPGEDVLPTFAVDRLRTLYGPSALPMLERGIVPAGRGGSGAGGRVAAARGPRTSIGKFIYSPTIKTQEPPEQVDVVLPRLMRDAANQLDGFGG